MVNSEYYKITTCPKSVHYSCSIRILKILMLGFKEWGIHCTNGVMRESALWNVRTDRHPCCSFGFVLCLSITPVSIKQIILSVVRSITTLVRKTKQKKKKKNNKKTSNDQWQWQTVQIQIEHNIVFPIWVCTVCSLHFLTKLRYAVYGIFIEIICLNKCSTNMGGARTARPCRPIGTHVDSFVFILRLSNTQFKNK